MFRSRLNFPNFVQTFNVRAYEDDNILFFTEKVIWEAFRLFNEKILTKLP